MSKFRIPEEVIPGFDYISKLNEPQVKLLASIIKNVHVGIGIIEFEELLRLKAKVSSTEIESLARTLYSFGGLLEDEKISAQEFAKEITDSYVNQVDKKVDSKTLKKNIIQLLSNYEKLVLTFKAMNLLSENDNIFRKSKIVSDVRLIFNENMANKDRNAVLVHRMKIDYSRNNNDKEFFFSLDTNDLEQLKKQIDRALEKTKQIKNSYGKTITFVEIGD